jgi:hypothetical protein
MKINANNIENTTSIRIEISFLDKAISGFLFLN